MSCDTQVTKFSRHKTRRVSDCLTVCLLNWLTDLRQHYFIRSIWLNETTRWLCGTVPVSCGTQLTNGQTVSADHWVSSVAQTHAWYIAYINSFTCRPNGSCVWNLSPQCSRSGILAVVGCPVRLYHRIKSSLPRSLHAVWTSSSFLFNRIFSVEFNSVCLSLKPPLPVYTCGSKTPSEHWSLVIVTQFLLSRLQFLCVTGVSFSQ